MALAVTVFWSFVMLAYQARCTAIVKPINDSKLNKRNVMIAVTFVSQWDFALPNLQQLIHYNKLSNGSLWRVWPSFQSSVNANWGQLKIFWYMRSVYVPNATKSVVQYRAILEVKCLLYFNAQKLCIPLMSLLWWTRIREGNGLATHRIFHILYLKIV